MAKGVRRRRKQQLTETSTKKRSKPTLDLAEHIDSDEDDYEDDKLLQGHQEPLLASDEEDVEVKRVRLAREYLEKIEAASDESSSSSSDEEDQDRLGRRLQKQRLKRQGTLERALATKVGSRLSTLQSTVPVVTDDSYAAAKNYITAGHVQLLRGHDSTPTSVALQSDGRRAVSGSKDHSVILWDIEKTCRITNLCPHWKKKKSDNNLVSRTDGQVWSVDLSDDGRYAAVGVRDGTVRIFDVRSGGGHLVKTFEGHKDAITSLCFRTNTHQLFSASQDRCIRHYNLDEMLYIETLYGHQFGVSDIDCSTLERPISVGRDRTARAWKLAQDTHLIFRGGGRIQAAQSVSVIKDDWFLTGHEDGHLSLWMTDKKRAVQVHENAHGLDDNGTVGRGIVSVSSVQGSDVAATGSNDGYLRFWNVKTGEERGLDPLGKVPIHGYVNDIAFGPKAKFCILAVGQEHRLGRWNRVPRAKNRIAIVKLQTTNEQEADSSDDQEDIDLPPEEQFVEEESSSDESESD